MDERPSCSSGGDRWTGEGDGGVGEREVSAEEGREECFSRIAKGESSGKDSSIEVAGL
jgi:hypothetical protein